MPSILKNWNVWHIDSITFSASHCLDAHKFLGYFEYFSIALWIMTHQKVFKVIKKLGHFKKYWCYLRAINYHNIIKKNCYRCLTSLTALWWEFKYCKLEYEIWPPVHSLGNHSVFMKAYAWLGIICLCCHLLCAYIDAAGAKNTSSWAYISIMFLYFFLDIPRTRYQMFILQIILQLLISIMKNTLYKHFIHISVWVK